MLYTLLIYSFLAYVFGLKNYLKKKNVSLYIKVIHILITFELFFYYFSNFRIILWDFFRNGVDAFYTSKEFLYYSKTFDFFSTLLFLLTSSFMAGLSLNLAVKAESRKLLIFFSPLIIFATSLHLYKYMLEYYKYNGDIYLYLITVLLLVIIYGAIVVFYILKPVRTMFNKNELESTRA